MADALSETERAAYQRDGYLCPIDVFTPEEAAAHRAAFEALERDFAGRLPRPVGEYMRMSAHLTSDAALTAARDPRVLDRVEGILGPDVMLWTCEYFVKEAHSPQIVSSHQDLTLGHGRV